MADRLVLSLHVAIHLVFPFRIVLAEAFFLFLRHVQIFREIAPAKPYKLTISLIQPIHIVLIPWYEQLKYIVLFCFYHFARPIVNH